MSTLLKQSSKKDELVAWVGISEFRQFDLWISCQFIFDRKAAEVKCFEWEVTDAYGKNINVNQLPYEILQRVVTVMADEVETHSKIYYDELEAESYSGPPADRLEDV